MEKMPKEWILEHKKTKQAFGFLKANHKRLIKYLIHHQINDLYELHQQYVPINQYQTLRRKYNNLKQDTNQDDHNHAVVGKATVKNHQQPGPAPSIINQLKHHQN